METQLLTLSVCFVPQVQQLIRAAKTNTRDGLERTRTAMIRKVSFLHRKVSTGLGETY